MTFLIAERNKLLGYFLFETMRVEGGKIIRETYHRDRIQKSMLEMGWPGLIQGFNPMQWWELFKSQLFSVRQEPFAVKVLVIPDQDACIWEWQSYEIPSYPTEIALSFLPDAYRHSADPFLRWKTGSWGRNLHALHHCPHGVDDILFVNERGEVCETARSNLFLLVDNHALTPPEESGVLPGTVRSEILKRGAMELRGKMVPVRTGVIHKKDLNRSSRLWVSNALMGVRPAFLVD